VKKSKAKDTLTVVRKQVNDLLTRSSAFRELPPQRRKQIANDMVKIANYLVSPETKSDKDQTVANVDFPEFVSGLLKGVFQAIVDASIRQMEEYAELLSAASKSVDDFIKKTRTDKEAFDYLFDRVPDFSLCRESKKKRPRVRLASGRQQVLATMVLMGINRIVVTQGTIKAKRS
jgi:hypothetical protein